ncbi:hypothetical protein AXYL_06725 (plasmid) [Achromobacter xylosoxidans A8]|uniref:Uncharacterized protein n=1 Tax=Achromobacter xylosoxidans (strain A8) TaxID=762376 RepID=E3HY55_ACHXA|nr:hypothetical protein AXYL_06725 [Achromobacter xylosoxidans A8]
MWHHVQDEGSASFVAGKWETLKNCQHVVFEVGAGSGWS